jgi:hypothetical protein
MNGFKKYYQRLRRLLMSRKTYLEVEKRLWFEAKSTSDRDQISMYWHDRGANRLTLVDLLVTEVKHLSPNRDAHINIVELGCHVGVNLKLLKEALDKEGIGARILGLEPNTEAFNFAKENLPYAEIVKATDREVEEILDEIGGADLVFVSAVLYVLDEDRVLSLLQSIAKSTSSLIIADEVENSFGSHTQYRRGQALLHPFATWLNEFGFDVVIRQSPEKQRAHTGFVIARKCIDPAESAQVKPIMRMPQRQSSCPAPDVGGGGCRS